MFVNRLHENEKIAFAALLDALIHSDEVLTIEEETIRVALYKEMNLDYQPDQSKFSLESACSAFLSHSSKVAALFELIGVGLVDSEYSAEESELVSRIGLEFGFSELDITHMENLVITIINSVDEAQAFMEEN